MPRSRSIAVSLSALLAVPLFLVSPTATAQGTMHEHPAPSAVKKAIAVLQPTKGSSVRGTVTYEAVEGGVHVVADVTGLTPGKHGFHIHEFGDLSSDDGSSAGGHFNPAGTSHGAPTADPRHAGDMGNIEADKDGHAKLDYVDHVMSLTGEASILGHAVVVHEKEDDMKSQPTGNAGGRVAYGVIGIAKSKQ
jgi:superoxide dismutase, Cu-Zn family